MITPGEWTPEYKSAYEHNIVSYTEPKSIICTCNVPEYGSKMDNFTLIAAAPDLLDACECVVNWHREHDSGNGELFGLDFITDCINAILKAKGDI